MTLSTLSNATFSGVDATGQVTIVDDDDPRTDPEPRPEPRPEPKPEPEPETPASRRPQAPQNVNIDFKGCVKIGANNYRFTIPKKKIVDGKVVRRKTIVKEVRFYLDGKALGKTKKPPFIAKIDGTMLKPGLHKLVAKVKLQHPKTKKVTRRKLTYRFGACQ